MELHNFPNNTNLDEDKNIDLARNKVDFPNRFRFLQYESTEHKSMYIKISSKSK